MDPFGIVALLAAGLVAGVINTLAGGGSLLSVPLLVFLGLPGDVANGTNRVGILVQSIAAIRGFHAEGVPGLRHALPVLLPVSIGSLVGAVLISRLASDRFEHLFGAVMLALLVPTLRGGRRRAGPSGPAAEREEPTWPPWLRLLVFFTIGLYGGAIQAGVGLMLVVALSHTGYDLVRANSIKVVLIAVFTGVAIPVFIIHGQIAWLPAGALTTGFAIGGRAGARLAVRGGERMIRPVLAGAVAVLAGRMLGLY